MQIKLSVSPSHCILTPDQPVPALTLCRQAPDRVATGVPIFKSLVQLKIDTDLQQKRESNPGLRLSRQMPYHTANQVVPEYEWSKDQVQDISPPADEDKQPPIFV